MKFEQFSEIYREIKSPVMDFSIHGDSGNSFVSFTELLKKEDAKSKKILRRYNIIYTIIAVFYFLLTIVNPDKDLNIQNRIAGGCYVIAFVIFVWMLRKMYKKIKKVNYATSPKMFLEEAKIRFSFWTKLQLPLIPFLILINAGASISLTNYFGSLGIMNGLILFQLIFLVFMAFGFFMGKRNWSKNKKPILNKIDEMLSGFED